ncbi:MAG TPA: LptF/LptG family permease [Gemmatimonadaceae bacterium]
MKIISKYVLKEHAGPLIFALTALTSLLLLNYIAKQFGELVGKGIPWQAILQFFVLSIPFTFAMTVPMAVLVAVLFAFSRLASENEIVALRASGVGSATLMVPVLLAAALVSVGMILFNDQVLPRANHRLATLQGDIVRTKPTFALKPQVMNPVQEGRMYMRASRIAEGSSRLFDVVLYDLSDQTRRRTIYADSGSLAFASNGIDLLMTLHHGYMLEVPTERQAQLSRLFFDSNILRFRGIGNRFSQTKADSSQGIDIVSDREMTVCQMATRAQAAEERLHRVRHELAVAQAWAKMPPGSTGPAESSPPPFRPGFSWGMLYCDLVKRIGPKEAGAQQAPTSRPAIPKGWRIPDWQKGLPPDQQYAVPESLASGPGPAGASRTMPQPVPQPVPAPVADSAAVVVPGPATAEPAAGGQPPMVNPVAQSRLDDAQATYLDARRELNRYLVEIHKKFALAVACFVFALVGAPIALRFPRGGVGLVIGVSLGIFGLYYVGLIGGETLADRGMLSPMVAMWAANMLMGSVGVVLVARMGRERGTARGGDLGDRFAAWRERRRARQIARARG